ncbi:MFS general substrate transporter [Xylariaceae sp. FL0662B]|nr:MFS general substrate transporter [Xylariaceae sp. FL0662B]
MWLGDSSITLEVGTVDDVGWYSSSYLIAKCVRRVYLTRTYEAIFELDSLISAVSIAKRSFLNGLILGCLAVGRAVGPLIGGALTQTLSWRWCFYVNRPIGGCAVFLFVAIVRLPVMKLSTNELSLLDRILIIDIVGFFTFGAACTMFLLDLRWNGTEYAWNSATIIGLICADIVTFGVLECWFAYRGESALMPPRLLYDRINVVITITSFMQTGATITALYWLPSGVMILPMILSQLVASVLSGALVQKTGYYLPEVIIAAFVAVRSGLMSTFSPATSGGDIIGYQIIVGACRGLVLRLLVTATQANVPQEDVSIASAYAMFSQYLGGALFSSIAKTIFASSVRTAVQKFAPDVETSLLISSGVTKIAGLVPAGWFEGVLLAYNEAIDHVFRLVCAFVTGWGMGWKNLKKIRQDEEVDETNSLAFSIPRSQAQWEPESNYCGEAGGEGQGG